MARFYAEYQHDEILQPLVGEISWTKHILILTKCKDTQERRFYILATKRFGWTKNVLMHQIEAKAFENYLLGQSNYDQTLPQSVKNQATLALRSLNRRFLRGHFQCPAGCDFPCLLGLFKPCDEIDSHCQNDGDVGDCEPHGMNVQ